MLLDSRLHELVSLWENACAAGQEIAPEQLCKDHPDLLDKVRKIVQELKAADRHVAGVPLSEDGAATMPLPPPESSLPPAQAVTPTPAEAPTRVRCPHCHNPIQLARDSDEVLCPGCGSGFRLRDARHTDTTSGMKKLGKFQLLERLGLGGFGAVWKARDNELDRIVALKIPHSGLLSEYEELERFQREARAAAQLRHPHIVSVHAVETLNGLPVIVAEYVQGVPLRDLLQVRRLTFRQAAALVAAIADALDYAHGMGVVHRDVKPANIMLEMRARGVGGEAAAAGADGSAAASAVEGVGKPMILDFGLALRDAVETTMTIDGHVLGTPAYMSPEQAVGQSHRADRRSDVYSLGVVLYELLTGELPFRGSRLMLLQQVLHEEPRPPRRLNDKVPRDLETIRLKCLAKKPERRYATARDLADELRRFLAGEAIRARPVGWLERTVKWVRRRPALAGMMVTLAAVVVAAFAAVTWQLGETNAALKRVEQEQRQRALAQVNALRDAAPGAVPGILADLERTRADVLPRLRELWAEGGAEGRRMRLALALAPVDPETVRAPLVAWMLKAEDPAEVLLVRDALLPHKQAFRERLWELAQAAKTPAAQRLRALTALAAFDPESKRWSKAGNTAADLLLSANPFYQGQWARALRPARAALRQRLAEVCRGAKLAEFRQPAALLLADYAAEEPELVAAVFLDAEPKQAGVLLPVLKAHRARAVVPLRRALAATIADGAPLAQREALAKRQAIAGVALLHLGDDEPVWPLFRHTPEPEARSQLVWRTGLYGVDPVKLVRRLETEKDTSARRALIVALGDYSAQQLPKGVREPLTAKLLTWYRDDPDPGIHGAIDWLLRHGKEGPTPRPLDWGQARELRQIDEGLKRRDPDGVRRWYVNKQGQTLVLVPGPVEFRMGAPADEPGWVKTERLHRRKIRRSFAIGSKAVTVEHFQRFLKDRPDVRPPITHVYAPEGDCPIIGVSWYMAAQYCNWLSEQEGIPEEQWCYPKHAAIKDGMKMPKGYLQRTGYRLATEAEWECACRAGADSSRSYGSSTELLPRYAWYLHNAGDRSRPVGQKRPNDLGLFDMHGNVFTWVQDGYFYYPQGAGVIEDKEDIKNIEDRISRVLRGGSFYYQPLVVRSARRNNLRPDDRYDSVGLRVARTYD